MRVAVLGGGLQGCCIALALSERGVDVVLYDRNDALLSRAGVANEGKIHLGYMYSGDPSLRTARRMIVGALAFAPFLSRTLGVATDRFSTSAPAVYLVHRASQRDVSEVGGYLAAVRELIAEAAAGRAKDYFGIDLSPRPRSWSAAERDEEFGGDVVAAFDTPEVAIDPVGLAALVRARVASTPRIELRLGEVVRGVEDGARLDVVSHGPAGAGRAAFDHVVNALWDGRLAIDATRGLRPMRPWLHRLKYGVSFTPPAGRRRPRSATVVLGPFGEVVNYADGSIYLTWYPDCLLAYSRETEPPAWPTHPSEADRRSIFEGTLAALSEIVLPLRQYHPHELADVTVRGGAIVAWGNSDIDDPHSELHNRFEIGVTTTGRYHSVDPGKLTLAPYFADICADRIRQ